MPLNPGLTRMTELLLRPTRTFAALVAAWWVTSGAWAQPAVQPASLPLIRGFSVQGSNPLTDAEVTLALAAHLRQPATLENLQKASYGLEALLRERGFGLYRVVLPPQEVGEVIQLQVVRFAIGQVTVDGAKAYSETNVRSSLPMLKQGGTPNLEALAVQTAMANENPSKNVQVALRAAAEPDLIDATVSVVDSPPLKFSATLNNTGSQPTGKDRLTLSVRHDNLMDRDQQLQAAVTTSLAQPSRVRQIGLSYRLPLYDALTFLDVQLTDSNVVGEFGAFTSTGAGRSLGLTATRYLSAKPGLKQYAMLGFEDKTFDATSFNGVALAGQQGRRTRPLSLGYGIKAQTSDQNWSAGLTLALNLPGGAGNSLSAYQSESPLVTTQHWRAVRAQAAWAKAMGEGWVVSLRGQAQWAPTALIAGEQFGIGGHASLRGMQERALTGDSGLSTNLEVASPEWLPGFRVLAFWDAGRVIRRGAAGSGVPTSDGSASVGLGLRYARGSMSVALDYGRIVSASDVPLTLNSSAPQSGDHKLHFLLSAHY